MTRQNLIRITIILAAVAGVSALHYKTATSQLWLHELFQHSHYIPVLVAAIWFGQRGGLLTAAIAGLSYMPHILLAWRTSPAHIESQYVEIGMFFVVGALAGMLADQQKQQRIKVEKMAQELREVYAQLQSSFEQLRRADRLSALGELSAGLAHEIRNPLGSIEGALQVLQRRELPESSRQEFGALAQDEINRLKSLVSNFIEFARPQTPRRVNTNLADLIESVRLLAGETAKLSGVRVRVQPFDESLTISVDPEQIKQVLLNLVINAVQAMPQGGRNCDAGARAAPRYCYKRKGQRGWH